LIKTMSTRPAAVVEHVDRYNSPSAAGGSGIFLAASSSAASTAPFFRGYLAAPRRSADLALLLAHVVQTRFYTPPGMLQRLILQRDPVITCGGGMLRLEGFSACCGVYARLDLRGEAFDADCLEPGTSNVDFNSPMRAALAKLRDGERARLEVSASGFTLTSQLSGPAFERRVELPVRWIKGFVEVQAHQARMERRFEISGVIGQRFLRDLPRQRTAVPVWLTPLSNSLRLSHAPVAGGVLAGGIQRLKLLAEVARHAKQIVVYASADGATAWRLETPDARLFLVLSPEPSRGFSGEGQVLGSLARGSTITSRVRALLRWQRHLAPRALAEELQASEADVQAALAELGTFGLVGYDLAEGTYFHRELPFDVSRIPRLHPRLNGARELARAGAVEMNAAGAWVRGREADYYVRRDADGQWRCSCPWASRHGASRGPCKHVLAVQIAGRVEGKG
jgi:SWIM zinc finger